MITKPAREIILPPLHPGQRQVQQSAARFKVLSCGRRWGKSRLAALLLLAKALQGGQCWWIAPSYATGDVGWNEVRRLALQIPGGEVNRSERFVMVLGGGKVQIRSGDDPALLRGHSLDMVVFDEAAHTAKLEELWVEVIRPALTDRRGQALFLSTPKGKNYFWQLYQYGLDPELPDWASWQFPTASNPFIAPTEIEAMRASMPEAKYQQEVLAEFVESGSVLRNVAELATMHPQPPVAGHEYYIGVDVARAAGGDFTVYCVYDATQAAVVHLDRFSGLEYSIQIDRLVALCERFQPKQCIIEVNGPGQGMYEQLRQRRLSCRLTAFKTTNQSKGELVNALSLALERKELRLLADPVLVAELQAFEAEDLPSGATRYAAPAGLHDDCVIALMLAFGPTANGAPPELRRRGWVR